jgi:subtilisin family serine protease
MKRSAFFIMILLAIAGMVFLVFRADDTKEILPSLKAKRQLSVRRLSTDIIRVKPAVSARDSVSRQPEPGPVPSPIAVAEERTAKPQPDNYQPEPDAIPGEFVLSFYDDNDRDAFAALAKLKGVEILDVIGFGHSVRVRVKTRDQLQNLLSESPTPVDYGPNHYVFFPERPKSKPFEPVTDYVGFGSQSLQWLGVTGDHSSWGKGITIAVLDTGVAQHPALSENNITRQNLVDGETSGISDYGEHGTAVASLIAGTSPDLPGIAPGSNILSIKVLSAEGKGDAFTLASGIVEAVKQGASIINLSLGTYGDSFILRDAVNFALESGVVIVAATGNDAIEGLLYPARYEGVLAVSGVDAKGRHLFFANRGTEVDIAAPGIGVNAALPGESIGKLSGTSAAVPFVSGSLAWLMSEDNKMSAEDAVEILCRYCDDVGAPGKDEETGHGILNICRVQDRDVEGIYDVALLSPYIPPLSANEERIGVVVSAQNRGTEYLYSVNLEVEMDGVLSKHTFYNIDIGETMSHEFLIDYKNLKQLKHISIRYSATIDGEEDINLDNNFGTWVIVPESK